jgi:hypothetical protein
MRDGRVLKSQNDKVTCRFLSPKTLTTRKTLETLETLTSASA